MNDSGSDVTALPEGWVVASLGEWFTDIRNGTTATQNKEGPGASCDTDREHSESSV